MVLAKEEDVLKQWKYATGKGKGIKRNYMLTVTNKRIISRIEDPYNVTQEEICISDVKSVSILKSIKAVNFWMILGGIIAFYGMICWFGSLSGDSWLAVVLGILLPLIGGALIFYGNKYAKQTGKICVRFSTYKKEGMNMFVGAVNGKFFNKYLRLKVDNDVSAEILETIGALIVENK